MIETKRPLKVFLCHAHSDKDTVKVLYDRLSKDGVDAWLDKEKILPGQDWELEICKTVRESDVVVVCHSKQFNQAGFRQKEVRLALDTAMEKPEGEIFIIPARLEECDILKSLSKWQWVDLFDDGYERLMQALQMRAGTLGIEIVRGHDGDTGDNVPDDGNKEEIPLKNKGVSGHLTLTALGKTILDILFSRSVLICGFLGVFVGGFLWNILNNLLGWPYYLGGHGNEPYGLSAFIWGSIVIFPVAFFAYLALSKYVTTHWRPLWKAPLAIALYTIFGGIGAVVFYNSGFRRFAEGQNLGYGAQELVIVSVWAFAISLLASLPVMIFRSVFKDVLHIQMLLFQILLCVVMSFLAVVVSLFIRVPETQVAMIRGFLAGLGLRFGLFIGIVLSILLKPEDIQKLTDAAV